VVGGLTAGLEKAVAAIDRGDAFAAGEGGGEFAMQVALLAEAGSGIKLNVQGAPVFATAGGAAQASLRLAVTATGPSLPPAAMAVASVIAKEGEQQGTSGSGASEKPVSESEASPGAQSSSGGEANATPKRAVSAYEVGKYGKMRVRSQPRDRLDLDHQPSNASNIARAEAELGRPLTPEEIRHIRDEGTAVAVPEKWHRQRSRTFGGRNTPEQIQADKVDPAGAAALDSRAMVEGAEPADRAAAEAAAKEVRERAEDL
jgi:hypothetical protein